MRLKVLRKMEKIMNNKNKLILLADRLDRDGLTSAASLINDVITKRSFDEETRGDVNSVLQMTLQLLEELDQAVDVGVAGLESEPGSGDFIKGYSGAIQSPSLKEFYKDKITRLREAAEHVQGLTLLTSEEQLPGDDSKPEADEPANPSDPTASPEEASEGEPDTPWWKFWEKSEENEERSNDDEDSFEPVDEETALPNPGPAIDPESGSGPSPVDVEEYDEEADEGDQDESGANDAVKRTRFPGVSVEQSMSNVGNVTIGE